MQLGKEWAKRGDTGLLWKRDGHQLGVSQGLLGRGFLNVFICLKNRREVKAICK